jgi:salicylate hydroxylase
MYWDRQEPDVPEGWVPNLPTKSLQLSDSTSDRRYSNLLEFSMADGSAKVCRLIRMFEKIDSVCWKKFLEWPEIENWSDDSARIVLLGEAARPVIVRPLLLILRCFEDDPLQPCSTQNCSVSVETAAVLSALLSYVREFDHIPVLVRAYETICRERTEFLHRVEMGRVAVLMYPPGPERTARDEQMRKLLEKGHGKWGDDAYMGLWGQICECWAYNAFDAADDWWIQWGVLRERSLPLESSNIETPFRRLEVSVTTAHTDRIYGA